MTLNNGDWTMSPELKRLKARHARIERKIEAKLAADPLLHLIYATKRLQDAARDVIQF